MTDEDREELTGILLSLLSASSDSVLLPTVQFCVSLARNDGSASEDALARLGRLHARIGYPQQWPESSHLPL